MLQRCLHLETQTEESEKIEVSKVALGKLGVLASFNKGLTVSNDRNAAKKVNRTKYCENKSDWAEKETWKLRLVARKCKKRCGTKNYLEILILYSNLQRQRLISFCTLLVLQICTGKVKWLQNKMSLPCCYHSS